MRKDGQDLTLQFVMVLVVMINALSALAVLALVWRRGQLAERPALSLLIVATFVYVFGYGLGLAGTELAWKLAAEAMQYLGIVFVPSLLLLVVGSYAFGTVLGGRVARMVLLGVSVTLYGVVLTDPLHQLVHVDPRVDRSGPLAVLAFQPGPFFYVVQAYVGASLVIANVALFRAWRRATGTKRVQVRTIAIASLFPWLGNIAYLAGAVPWGLDGPPFVLLPASFLIFRGVRDHALAQLRPIARELVFARISDPVLVVDGDGALVDRNDAGAAFLTDLESPAVPASAARLLADLPPLASAVDVARLEGESELHVRNRTFSLRLVDLERSGGRLMGHAVVLRDVTSYERMQRSLRELATTDALTVLPNRRHFLELAEQALERSHRSGRSIGWILLDLDRFKAINDHYGHDAGDGVLRAVADAMRETIRAGDIAGRIGGEEFAVCLPDTDLAGARLLAERLRAAVASRRARVTAGSLSVTASLGVCETSGKNLDLDTILALADGALYRAKREGRDRVVVATPSVPAD